MILVNPQNPFLDGKSISLLGKDHLKVTVKTTYGSFQVGMGSFKNLKKQCLPYSCQIKYRT